MSEGWREGGEGGVRVGGGGEGGSEGRGESGGKEGVIEE